VVLLAAVVVVVAVAVGAVVGCCPAQAEPDRQGVLKFAGVVLLAAVVVPMGAAIGTSGAGGPTTSVSVSDSSSDSVGRRGCKHKMSSSLSLEGYCSTQ
jgi:hypothetical protein